MIWRGIMKITVIQSFYAMFYLLDNYYDRKKIDDLGAMLGSMSPDLFDGDMPADIAIWHEWLAIVKEVAQSDMEVDCLDDILAYESMLAFLNYYNREFGVNIDIVIEDLAMRRVDTINVQKMWQDALEKANAH